MEISHLLATAQLARNDAAAIMTVCKAIRLQSAEVRAQAQYSRELAMRVRSERISGVNVSKLAPQSRKF